MAGFSTEIQFGHTYCRHKTQFIKDRDQAMEAKNPRNPIHSSNLGRPRRTTHLKERRFYELDRVYLRQLRRLSQVVWNAKLKRDRSLSKPKPIPLDGLTPPKNTTTSQKTL